MTEVSVSEKDLTILRDPKLFDRITMEEFNKFIVHEYDARRAIFLSLCSIWVKKHQGLPNIFVNSESSAGKSYIVKQIIKIFPKEMVQYRTKISPEAFTYWHNPKFEPEWTWDGKILYLEDISQDILDANTFKVMCSEGSIATIVVKQKAIDIEIVGKPTIILTTADTNPNNEILNRFSIITLTETNEQTRKIIEGQAQKASSDADIKYDMSLTHALRGLKRVDVRIPFAEEIVKQFPDEQLRVRRDFPRFLDLIRASAAFHQYQRPSDGGVVIATLEDYTLAKSVFDSINTSQVFGMTKKQKTAYDACLQIVEEGASEIPNKFTAKEIFCFKPFVNERSWYEILDGLAKLNLLEISLEKRENSDKRVMHFSIKNIKKDSQLTDKGFEGNVGIVVGSYPKGTKNTLFTPFRTTIATNASNAIEDSLSQLTKKLPMELPKKELTFDEVLDVFRQQNYVILEGSEDKVIEVALQQGTIYQVTPKTYKFL